MTALHLACNKVLLNCNTVIVIKGQEGIRVFRMFKTTFVIVSDLLPVLGGSIVFSTLRHVLQTHPSPSCSLILTCMQSAWSREWQEQDQQLEEPFF